MVHFKAKLATFFLQAYIAFFTHNFVAFFEHCKTSLRSWSSEVIYSIKSHVLWKFSFTVWSISGQANGHPVSDTPGKIPSACQVGNIAPCCNDCNVEKVYEQGPVPFFSRIVGRYDSSKQSIRSRTPIPLLYKPIRCVCVTSLAPLLILRLTLRTGL